ncbi:MAG: hypothetical protein ACLP1X_21635 [Polyangiaceae bacterium]
MEIQASGSGTNSASTGSASGGNVDTSGSVSGAGSVSVAGVTSGAVSEDSGLPSGSSAGMSGYCDQAEVNGGPQCPLCQNGMLTKCMGDCVDLGTDPNSCGGCGITCPVSAPSCQNGNCVPVADASTDAMEMPDAGIDVVTPASCAPGGPGMTNCGPGGSGTEPMRAVAG